MKKNNSSILAYLQWTYSVPFWTLTAGGISVIVYCYHILKKCFGTNGTPKTHCLLFAEYIIDFFPQYCIASDRQHPCPLLYAQWHYEKKVHRFTHQCKQGVESLPYRKFHILRRVVMNILNTIQSCHLKKRLNHKITRLEII